MSDANTSPAPGFSWSGSLEEFGVRGVYAALGAMRFSGVLTLADRAARVEVQFLGGDPVEIAGGDTAAVSLWSRGTFNATQFVPTFDNELSRGLVLTGSLERRRTSALWAFIGQHRLSCDVVLEHGEERAQFHFAKGRAEKAELGGLPELAALASVADWTSGRFTLSLTPLFDGPVAKPEVTPLPESSSFDISSPVELPPEQPAAPSAPGQGPRPSLFATPRASAPPPPTPANAPTSVVDSSLLVDEPNTGDVPATMLVGVRRRRRLYIVGGAVVVGSVAAILVVALTNKGPLAATPQAITSIPTAPSAAPVAPAPTAAVPAVPAIPATAPAVAAPTPVAASTNSPTHAAGPVDALVAKARLLLINGHPHTAAETLARAQKLRPGDALVATLLDQARGKLGNAEIDVIGRGSVNVDGKSFAAPVKIKLPAGPHSIDGSELVWKRGEKRSITAK